jgi:hypothetical protein
LTINSPNAQEYRIWMRMYRTWENDDGFSKLKKFKNE